MKKNILITGSCGLVGSEAVSFFCKKNFKVIGIDNNYRLKLFGKDGDNYKINTRLLKEFESFKNYKIDIRDFKNLKKIFTKYKFHSIIHAAAQPSHDWAVKKPFVDFGINALATLNLLELTKRFCKDAKFIYVSTNKVYGDRPNNINLKELRTRWEVNKSSKFYKGIDESMSIDNCTHSLFGVSKTSADLLVQEYSNNFGLKSAVFRAGCITGPNHAGAELHGFLNYLVKCVVKHKKYTIFGYKGKQVRDNIHSYDLVNAFWQFIKSPTKKNNIFNIGGGRKNSCSILEIIKIIENKTKIKLNYNISKKNRTGDHKWYITNNSKFSKTYKKWRLKYNLNSIIEQIIDSYS